MASYQDESLVKRANVKITYTKEQIDELSACLDPVTGPLFFIQNYMYIQHPIRGKEKIELYDFQIDLLDTYVNYRKSVNLLGRQLGKCLGGDTKIKIRNKTTKEIQSLTLNEFECIIKNSLGENNGS